MPLLFKKPFNTNWATPDILLSPSVINSTNHQLPGTDNYETLITGRLCHYIVSDVTSLFVTPLVKL
jgi:hypothetical protein